MSQLEVQSQNLATGNTGFAKFANGIKRSSIG